MAGIGVVVGDKATLSGTCEVRGMRVFESKGSLDMKCKRGSSLY